MYFATPSNPGAIQAMNDHVIGLIRQPIGQGGDKKPINPIWCADTGCYTKNGSFDETRWWTWLQKQRNNPGSCIFATAPDVVGDAQATLIRSQPWFAKIRALGFPPAYVAQDGIQDTTVPWDDFDVLFIGGRNEFKLGLHARTVATQARRHGKWLHVGRVNSLRRYRFCEAIKADSCDGTYLTYGPDTNLPKLLRWVNHRQSAFDLNFT